MAEVVGLVAAIVQLAGAAAKVTSFVITMKKAPEEFHILFEESNETIGLLGRLRRRIEDSSQDWTSTIQSLEGPCRQLELQLTKLTSRLTSKSRVQQVSSKILWPIEKEEVKEVLGRIERLKTLIALSLADNIT